MPWARLDDTFHNHTKVQDCLDVDDQSPDGLAAIGVWTLALSRSYMATVNRPLVYRRELRRLVSPMTDDPDRLANRLVRVGLWEEHPEGWLIHGWAEYRPAFDNTESRRLGGQARAATAPRKGGRFASGNTVDSDQLAPAEPARAGELAPAAAGPAAPGQPVPSRTPTRRESKVRKVTTGGGHQLEPWSEAWEPFLEAWQDRYRYLPTQAQREALWDAVDARPKSMAEAVRSADQGVKAGDMVRLVLDRFHELRIRDNAEAARAEVEADARRFADTTPREAGQPTPIAQLLKGLVAG